MMKLVRTFVSNASYVPKYTSCPDEHVAELQRRLDDCTGLLVITGAGVSTESGIPDYRSPVVGRFATSNTRPMTYQEFVRSDKSRKRYWARNYAGWPLMSATVPNINHSTLAEWEKGGRLVHLITQNVDALHTRAGSRRLTELHGCMQRVRCIHCAYRCDRQSLQETLERANRDWSASAAHLAPDGDVDVHDQLIETFTPPECPVCRVCSLMPDVVFFGDSVPRTVVDECFDALRRSTATLVLGSTLQVNTNRIAPLVSLQVMSSYRFVRECKQQHKPVYIVNIGETRADAVADYKIESKCSDVLQRLRF